MKKKIIQWASILSILMFLFSCEGDPGPEGPQGKNGNANIFTAVYEQLPSSWSGDTNGFSVTLQVPEITEDIYENGAVIVYVLHEDVANKNFNMLPYTYIDGDSFEYMDFQVYIGSVVPTIKWVDFGRNTTEAPGVLYIFKVVIIQGYKLTTLKKGVNLNDYNATMKYLKTIEKSSSNF